MNISNRLAALREVLRREHLDAFIFPTSDPHCGEFIPDYWKGREFVSGFCGSAGTAVVTLDRAALWTDSRYFLAAEEQLSGTEFVLMREKLPETPTVVQWLGVQLARVSSAQVGIDGMVWANDDVEELIVSLRNEGGITLRTNFDPLAVVWKDRPALPKRPVTIQPLEYAGERCKGKLERIRKEMKSQNAEGLLVTCLDEIAWTLNLRGCDVHCSPLFVSYLLVERERATLFVDKDKAGSEVEAYLEGEGVAVAPYSEIQTALRKYGGYSIQMDGSTVNYTLFNIVRCVKKINRPSPTVSMMTVKNDNEIAGMKRAMKRDGVALVKFLMWLKPAVGQGGQTEISIGNKLTSLRAENTEFRGLSFDTIAAYQEHGAIIHYQATEETNATLRSEGTLLLDTGAQYVDGTTDITRTIALGETSSEQRKIYTLVLKGHIAIELCKFPTRTTGTQIDILARKDMWKHGYNYLHGTGHGVGTYLNVHEGKHQFRMEWRSAPLVKGMTITDEPGIYLDGEFGCRTENVLLIKHYKDGMFGEYLQFEPLTLCPIDTSLIEAEMLNEEETEWINAYHKYVYDELAPLLSVEETEWLGNATKELGE